MWVVTVVVCKGRVLPTLRGQTTTRHARADGTLSLLLTAQVVLWSVRMTVAVSIIVAPERVHFVQESPADSNLVLLAQSSKANQLALLDPRTARIVAQFGWDDVRWRRVKVDHGGPARSRLMLWGRRGRAARRRGGGGAAFSQTESLSSYIQPAWHPGGHMVVCGTHRPLVQVWDVRYNRLSLPSQSLPLHEKRVLRCAFHPVDPCLVTVSTDCQLGFTSYHLTHG